MSPPLSIGKLQFKHRLIQGPLAGYSCAPFRALFSHFTQPAYCVSEMLSAHDVLQKHSDHGRYLYRSPQENLLCYQISGTDPTVMANAALKLEALGADLIDINCGCPKPKIRKKGAGSALLEQPQQLIKLIKSVRNAIQCPLTVKIRLQGNDNDMQIAQSIADAGADALIVHGRHWTEDYDTPCNFQQIGLIKRSIPIPVIANGDISSIDTLHQAITHSHCDGFMISRASTGKPWLFQELLSSSVMNINIEEKMNLFISHLKALANLENEYQAVLQSKSLVRYYFKNRLTQEFLQQYYTLSNLKEIETLCKFVHLEVIC